MKRLFRLWRLAALTASVLALASSFQWALPPAMVAFRVMTHRDDSAVVADNKLRELPAEEFIAQIELALEDHDGELAGSLLAVTDELGHSVDPVLRQRVEQSQAFSLQRSAGELWDGVFKGDTSTSIGMAGSFVADMTVAGDVRDLWGEGSAYLNSEDPDMVVLVLASTGIALTAASYGSLGAALPARTGASILKALKRAGDLPKPLLDEIIVLARSSISREAMDTAVKAAKRADLGGAATAVARIFDPKALQVVREAAGDVATINSSSGYRAVRQTLGMVESTADVAKFRRLSEVLGERMLGTVKMLGRGILELGQLVWKLAGLLLAALGWLLGAAWTCFRLAVLMVRQTGRATRWVSRTISAKAAGV